MSRIIFPVYFEKPEDIYTVLTYIDSKIQYKIDDEIYDAIEEEVYVKSKNKTH